MLSQTVISRGNVRAEVSTPVDAPSSIVGDPVITGIDVAAGDEVIEGQRVVEVSGRPVFVMTGAVPVYRTLSPGMTGEDVTQLQQALTRLGYAVIDEPGVYGDSTKACVAQLYNDAGYDPVPTSPTEAADLSTASTAVSDADASVAVAQATFDRAATGAAKSSVLAAQQALAAAQHGCNDDPCHVRIRHHHRTSGPDRGANTARPGPRRPCLDRRRHRRRASDRRHRNRRARLRPPHRGICGCGSS